MHKDIRIFINSKVRRVATRDAQPPDVFLLHFLLKIWIIVKITLILPSSSADQPTNFIYKATKNLRNTDVNLTKPTQKSHCLVL